ncbi:ankyrin repeat domain-containing protein [Enterobacter sp. I4]|uniref:ankyrin repeat domain-containing protein n=1 Tax=Enterobacter TaxID=547 RepID=UPI001F56CA4C|nr:ankyrin repeat domain-containing protein [Enterobacter sp. I4]MCI2291788.1 ankyrin repeat domain-containing protein [Enterobacter sp. I4]
MNKMIVALTLLFILLIVQGCKENMQYEPQDFFDGQQLKIAQIIYDGNEEQLSQKLMTVSKDELNRPAKAEMTLLFWSVLNSTWDDTAPARLKIITDLVKAGADPLQPRSEGGSSPAEFVLQGDKGIWIKAMLDGGLSPDARDTTFDKPIIFETLKAKNTETLKVMLESGADINARGAMERTLLINALYAGKIDHIKLLLDKGANPQLSDSFDEDFIFLINKEISRKDNNNEYVKSLINIRDTMLPNSPE